MHNRGGKFRQQSTRSLMAADESRSARHRIRHRLGRTRDRAVTRVDSRAPLTKDHAVRACRTRLTAPDARANSPISDFYIPIPDKHQHRRQLGASELSARASAAGQAYSDSGSQIKYKSGNGDCMRASGAVSRVRQARTACPWSAARGCPHESRRGHAFSPTCGGPVASTEALVDFECAPTWALGERAPTWGHDTSSNRDNLDRQGPGSPAHSTRRAIT